MDLNQFKFFIKRPVHGPKKTNKTGFHRSGPVFLSSRTKKDRSRSWSFNFGPKNQTGLDLQTLIIMKPGESSRRTEGWGGGAGYGGTVGKTREGTGALRERREDVET